MYLFILAVLGLHCFTLSFSSCSKWRLLQSTQASHFGGFSCGGVQTLGCVGFSSYGTQVKLPCGMWDLPGPRIELVSLALQSRFLTTGPPGEPNSFFHKQMFLILRKSSLSIFFFYGLLRYVISKKDFFFPVFSSTSFIVLGFTFRFMIHIELILYKM